MKDLIRGSINWDALGGQKSEYRFELGKAVIHKDTGVLDMPVRLNFVMPFLDYEKIKAEYKDKDLRPVIWISSRM